MTDSAMRLFEPMLERDAAGIRTEALRLANEDGVDAVMAAVTRFAVLAYASSQHPKHAFLACCAARELRESLGERYLDAVTCCAVYAAESRLPWSEPPILETPPALSRTPDVSALLHAVESKDVRTLESWLYAASMRDDFPPSFFRIAAVDDGDLGHKYIVATSAWRLAASLPPQARYATLRTTIIELCAHEGERYEATFEGDRAELLERVVSLVEAEEGGPVAAHVLHLFDAAVAAERFGAARETTASVLGAVDRQSTAAANAAVAQAAETPLPVYPYARDFAGYLECFAIAQRLSAIYGETHGSRIINAALRNLSAGESFERWSFA